MSLHQSPSSLRLSAARVRITGINYAPENTGIAPYTTQMAEHLAALGARVDVVTGMPHYPAWRLSGEYSRRVRVRQEKNGVRILRLRHYVPASQDVLRRALFEATFALHVVVPNALPRPDLHVVVVPNLLGSCVQAWLSGRSGVPVVVLVQDLIGSAAEQSGMRWGRRVSRLTNSLERRLLLRATRVAVLNDTVMAKLLQLGVAREKIAVLPNWAHDKEPQASPVVTRARLGWGIGKFVVLHAGNMGLKQDLQNVVAAAAQAEAKGMPVLFVLMGGGSQRPYLEEAAKGLSTMYIQDSLQGQEYADALGAADLLLVNERETMSDMSLPSKLTSYFTAARPVLAACAAGGTTSAEVGRSGGGVVIAPGDPAMLLAGVERLILDVEERRDLAARGHAYAASHLNRAAALQNLAAVLQGALVTDLLPALDEHLLARDQEVDAVLHAPRSAAVRPS